MIAFLRLRKKEPELERPFKVPLYPYFPIIALVIGTFSFIAMVVYDFKLALIYFAIIGLCFLLFKLFRNKTIHTPPHTPVLTSEDTNATAKIV